jgi:hypothetical protein
VTACGGTIITNVSGTGFTENTWNDGTVANSVCDAGATGGGVSAIFAIPRWQVQGLYNGVQNLGPGIGVMRGIPDVAGNASCFSGYNIQVDGSTVQVGGTSAVAPLYAALTAVINAKIGTGVGYLNPTLYSLSDIYTGQNQLCRGIADGGNNLNENDMPAPYYISGIGWNGCTGLGVIDGNALLSWLVDVFEQDLYVSVVSEAQQEQTQSGSVVGGYLVELAASPRYSDFQPISFNWAIDGEKINQTSAEITVFIPVGSKGNPPVYSHTVVASATNAQGGTVSASYNLVFSKPQGNLIYAVDLNSETKTTSQTSTEKGGGWMRTTVSVPTLEDAILESLQYFFAPYNVTWLPNPTMVRGPAGIAYQTAVYAMAGSNVSVSATVVDAIGQSLTLSVLLPGAIVTTTTGGGWHPPKSAQVLQAQSLSRRRKPSPVSHLNLRKGKRVTGPEMLAHVNLVRQFSKTRRLDKKTRKGLPPL